MHKTPYSTESASKFNLWADILLLAGNKLIVLTSKHIELSTFNRASVQTVRAIFNVETGYRLGDDQ